MDEYYGFEEILNRMLNEIPDTFDKREGSIIYNALAPSALELSNMYFTIKNNQDLSFADTAVDEYLDRLTKMSGIQRYQATKAIKKATFKDANNSLFNIALNERFTIEDLTYKAVYKISDGVYQMECETAGTVGNNSFGRLIPINYINNLATATLEEILIPGTDTETDEELRSRYYDAVNEKAFGGNIMDYTGHTKAISGVGAVKVFPVWNGGGTVKLVILDAIYNKATDTLINLVQQEIDPKQDQKGIGIAPIGHDVTVKTVDEIEVNINAKISISPEFSFDIILENAINVLEEYFLSLRANWENETGITIRISQIEARILNVNGVIDVQETTINNLSSNIIIEAEEIPVLGEVNIVEL